jgi:hypothetical protein
MSAAALIAASLITLHAPGRQQRRVDINPAEIVMVSEPREHVANDSNCVIWTADGHFVAVVETCDQVRALLAAH